MYFNDMHSSCKYLNAFNYARDQFYLTHSKDTNLTVSGGDLFVEDSVTNKKAAEKLKGKLDACAVGNHDIENGENLTKLLETMGLSKRMLANNVSYSKETSLSSSIVNSIIIDKNNDKIGFIGVMPIDFGQVTHVSEKNDFIAPFDFEESINAVKNDIAELEKQGVNKIFVLTHTGEFSPEGVNYYSELAKLGGVDAVFGGHDHREVDRWETTERGEPVKIVATGASSNHGFEGALDYFGVLSLFFDDNGVIEKNKSYNKFIETSKFLTLAPVDEPPKTLFVLPTVTTCEKPLHEDNPTARIVADSNLWYVNSNTKCEKADFAFVNAGTIRSDFEKPEINFDDIAEVVPFTSSRLIKTQLTKKQIMDTLNYSAKSTSMPKPLPGLMQVSGMTYSVNPDLTVSDVKIVNPDGSVKYSLDELDGADKVTCVYDSFLATGVAGLSELEKDIKSPDVELFENVSRQVALKSYLENNTILYPYQNSRILFK